MKKNRMLIMFLFFWCTGLYGHGLQHAALEGGVGVSFQYHDGAPAAFIEVTVFSPGDGEDPFQRGRTDKNGGFLFYPHVPGPWRLVADDGMGHHVSHEIRVGEGQIQGREEIPSWTLTQRVIVGISVIFGLFGTIALALSRKRFKN